MGNKIYRDEVRNCLIKLVTHAQQGFQVCKISNSVTLNLTLHDFLRTVSLHSLSV